ncbi:MAG: spore maturation protein [Oscillospiraceae bacterium]|nr:spore maturation protein [Oscillospiraceae bacterium]
MEGFSAVLPVFILVGGVLWGLFRRVNVYEALTVGAAEGLRVVVRIFPSLLTMLVCISLMRTSGFLEAVEGLLGPVLSRFGIPPEVAPLLLIRPISGGGALGVGAELIAQYGPDSEVGRTAAVMLGSTETTFYTISVYFGGLGIHRTRYAVPAALCADAAGFLSAAWAVRVLF